MQCMQTVCIIMQMMLKYAEYGDCTVFLNQMIKTF